MKTSNYNVLLRENLKTIFLRLFFQNLKFGFNDFLKLQFVVILTFSVLILPARSFAGPKINKHYYNEEECLSLTEQDESYQRSIDRILKLKAVVNFNSLLAQDKTEKVSMMLSANETKFIKNKCFWYIRIEENHQTHLAFWKALLVDINGVEIYEEKSEPDTYKLIN